MQLIQQVINAREWTLVLDWAAAALSTPIAVILTLPDSGSQVTRTYVTPAPLDIAFALHSTQKQRCNCRLNTKLLVRFWRSEVRLWPFLNTQRRSP